VGLSARRWAALLAVATLITLVAVVRIAGPARADSYVPVSGAGSTWSANAITQWISDVDQFGMRINYAPTGSSDGRSQFLKGTVDFAASDIPFQSHPEDGSAPELPAQGTYAYMPVTSGGTSFMYNLSINGQRVTNLRLSAVNIVKIFTGVLTTWNDPAIKADNPGLALPARKIVPVVRSDGSGSTAQFTLFMIKQYGDLWNAYCKASGRAPACGETSFYPTVNGMIAQNGDLGVAGYVAQGYAQGAIGYVQYSYALNAKFPVAKVLNPGGYYTEPTPQNVAVSLLNAKVDTTDTDPSLYLTQDLSNVYTDTDPRTYVLSGYSYLILPTKVQGQFTTAKGKTLAAFSYYAMCQGQHESASLGYSPMPINLVQASFAQITKIPGAVVQNISISSCDNPTFSSSGANLLATTAPMPPACDKQGPTQCTTGTGGAKTATAVTGSSSAGSTNSGSGGSGSSTSGASTAAASGAHGSSSAAQSSAGTRSNGTRGATGSTASGTGAGSGSSATTGAAQSSDPGGSTSCDPSTGNCATADPSSSGSGSGQATEQAAANPVTLAAKRGWTSTQTLMVVVLLLLVCLVVAPSVAAAALAGRRHDD
jgi:phosphate transport system substrate-binding protein